MGAFEMLRTAAPADWMLAVTGITIWEGLAVGEFIVTVPLNVPTIPAAFTVTAIVLGAVPEVELMVSQLRAGAVVIVTDAVYGREVRFVNKFRGILEA